MTRCSSTAERGPRSLWAAALLAAACGLHGGCPAPSFREHGPRTLPAGGGGTLAVDLRAWARPLILVSPPEVLAGRAERYTVLEHMEHGGLWTLALEPEAGQRITVTYRVADGMRLPIEVGESLWFNQSSLGTGLVVLDGSRALRILIAVDEGLSELADITVTPSFVPERLVYSEVMALPTGCMLALDHYELEVRRGNERAFVAPGATLTLTVTTSGTETPMSLYAFDASRPSPRRQEHDDARCPAMDHVSWMLIASTP